MADDEHPADEQEVAQVVEEELERLVHHPRREAKRLRQVSNAGEAGTAGYLTVGRVMVFLTPIVLLVLGISVAVYYAVK